MTPVFFCFIISFWCLQALNLLQASICIIVPSWSCALILLLTILVLFYFKNISFYLVGLLLSFRWELILFEHSWIYIYMGRILNLSFRYPELTDNLQLFTGIIWFQTRHLRWFLQQRFTLLLPVNLINFLNKFHLRHQVLLTFSDN